MATCERWRWRRLLQFNLRMFLLVCSAMAVGIWWYVQPPWERSGREDAEIRLDALRTWFVIAPTDRPAVFDRMLDHTAEVQGRARLERLDSVAQLGEISLPHVAAVLERSDPRRQHLAIQLLRVMTGLFENDIDIEHNDGWRGSRFECDPSVIRQLLAPRLQHLQLALRPVAERMMRDERHHSPSSIGGFACPF